MYLCIVPCCFPSHCSKKGFYSKPMKPKSLLNLYENNINDHFLFQSTNSTSSIYLKLVNNANLQLISQCSYFHCRDGGELKGKEVAQSFRKIHTHTKASPQDSLKLQHKIPIYVICFLIKVKSENGNSINCI